MDDHILSFNVPNLVTIGIMGIGIYALFGFLAQLWHNRQSNTSMTGS